MNYIKEVARLLGCELGEEFNVILDNGYYSKFNPFKFTEIFLVDSCITGSLLLIVRRARCPVCKNIFVGKTEPRWFSKTCKNCGRRSGDTH